jgi:hypothetical protein
MAYLERSVAEATAIAEFSLRGGHPLGPVMWGFAYALVKPQCALLLIGGSWD